MSKLQQAVLDVELYLVGALLRSQLNATARDVLTWLEPEMFATFNLGAIYAAIQRQALKDNLIDIALLSSDYGQDLAMLADIMRQVPSSANLDGYAQKVRQFYQRREAQKTFLDVATELNNARDEQLDNITAKGLSTLSRLMSRGDKVAPVAMNRLLGAYFDLFEQRSQPSFKARLLFTGIQSLDDKLGGIGETDICIIAGRAGSGKTETAITFTKNILEQGSVLIFSLEMSKEQLMERLIASMSGVSSMRLRNPNWMNENDFARMDHAMRRLKDLSLFIVDKSGLTMDEIISITETHIQRHGKPKALIIDYIGLVRHGKLDAKINRTYQIAESMELLKTFAKNHHVPVLLLAQLNRNADGSRPTNADLRDSGSLEQDASQIVMVHNSRDKETGEPNQYTEWIVTKNRHGTVGTAYVEFHQGQFIECDQETARAAIAPKKQEQSNKKYGSFK